MLGLKAPSLVVSLCAHSLHSLHSTRVAGTDRDSSPLAASEPCRHRVTESRHDRRRPPGAGEPRVTVGDDPCCYQVIAGPRIITDYLVIRPRRPPRPRITAGESLAA